MIDGAGGADVSPMQRALFERADELADGGHTSPARAWTPPPETALGRARRLARFVPLIEAWAAAGPGRPALTMAEQDLLAVAELSVRRGSDLLIRLPGGLHRLPLLVAVLIAADTLSLSEPELSRLVGVDPPPGPVALVTPRLVRRRELDQLDAASAPVAPALHPHRLRGDGLASPLQGGRPRLVTGAARLLFVSPTTGFPPILGVPPRAVVIDAAAETEPGWLSDARNWAADHASVVITVTDLHEELEPLRPAATVPPESLPTDAARVATASPQRVDGELCWIADWPWLHRIADPLTIALSPSPADVENATVVEIRGRAHLIAVEDPSLAGIADVRERVGARKSVTLRSLRVLADQATETIAPHHPLAGNGDW